MTTGRIPCMMFAAAMAIAAPGDTWRYTGASYKTDAFSQAQYWTDNDGAGNVGATGAPLNADDLYLVENWKVMYTPASQEANMTFTFGGKRLTLGEIGKKAGYMEAKVYNINVTSTVLFGGEGLVLANGWIKANSYKNREHPIAGTITVTAPASAPFLLGTHTRYESMTLTLQGTLVGESSAGLRVTDTIQGATQGATATNVVVKLTGDCSGYAGTIDVTSALDRTSGQFGAALSLASVTMPGAVTVQTNSILRTASKTDIATVGSLTLRPGSCIALQTGTVDGRLTNGFFRTTGAFSAEGPVTVTIPSSIVPMDGTTMRLPIVEMPSGANVTTNAFAVEFTDTGTTIRSLAWLRFEVEEDTKAAVKRLVLVSKPVVNQIVSDYDSYTAGFDSSLTNAANWSDGLLPHNGADYISDRHTSIKVLRSITDKTQGYVFPGDSLTLSCDNYYRAASLFLFCPTFELPLLRMVTSQVAMGSYVPPAILRAGSFEMAGTTNTLTVQKDGYLEMQGPISGTGMLIMRGNAAFGSNGKVWLNGDNSGFKGRICLSVGSATPDDTTVFQTLYVANGNNLGGRMTTFTYDALTLEAYGLLCATNAARVELDGGLNRGLFVNGFGRIRADAGQTISVGWLLTLAGTLRKEGEGDLLFGGDAPRFSPTGGVPSVTPTEGENVLRVAAGGVGVESATALDGTALQFAPGGRLVCLADAADADLAARGLVNLKAATPFAAVDGLERIPVSVVSAAPPPSAGRFTLTVATVPTGKAEALRAIMGHVSPPASWDGWRAYWDEPVSDAAAGTVTLRVTIVPTGMRIIFR